MSHQYSDPMLYQDAVHYGTLLREDERGGTNRAQHFIDLNRIFVPDHQRDEFRAGVHAAFPRFNCTASGPVPVRCAIPIPSEVPPCDCGADTGCCACDEEEY